LSFWDFSGEKAEFLHNEVPKIIVPDNVRAQMRGLVGEHGSSADCKSHARLRREILAGFRGLTWITRFVRFGMTVELAQFARSA
jgi:hypothetical protein